MNNVVFDFSLQEVMRLSAIRRWGIIEMSRQQSVAEHSYNVAILAGYIIDSMGDEPPLNSIRSEVVNWALVHDLPELRTGDIPTPVKAMLWAEVGDMEQRMFPIFTQYKGKVDDLVFFIVKLADFIEAVQFLNKFCCDSRKEEIREDIMFNLNRMIRKYHTDQKFDVIVKSIIGSL